MADSESDLETDGLELALDTICSKHCSDQSSLKSKGYCSDFCELVEEYTGQCQVPLPQLKVLRTALCSFTKATAAFPDDCQHIHYVLSSLALSFFELMLFFGKEEFVEEPLKYIIDSFQECYTRLLRHRNIYLQHTKQIIKAGGPWENSLLQGIMKEADLPPKEVEAYLSSELPIFFELRVRYLQACERMQEAKALAKSCLENREARKHLYFHQAYLTCLYKASPHEHLHKEMAEIDGRNAVEIICNTENVEKDELLLSLCKAFLSQQLHNGDMYYIWDLVFIWSRLYLRAHPCRQGFLAECLQLASSATNTRAIFPFIKLVKTELGGEGDQVCVELCASALQLCDTQADSVTRSLVCKTIAYLLPHDLETCRACALLVFCQERSLEAYHTVCLLYMHPDEEPHPHNSSVRTNVRFHILQMLKERLCCDPEFWNLLTIRTFCLDLMSDKVMKAAVLSEMKEEEETVSCEELSLNNGVNDSCTQRVDACQSTPEEQTITDEIEKVVAQSYNTVLKRKKWRRRLKKRKISMSDDEADLGDDPEYKYNIKSSSLSTKPMYSLRRNQTNKENTASVKFPLNRKREYLSRCVKSKILKRKGHKKRWLQGLPRLELVHPVKEKKAIYIGKKRGRKRKLNVCKLELSYPDNEMSLTEAESGFEEITENEDKEPDMPHLENELELTNVQKENQHEQMSELEMENGLETHTDLVCSRSLGGGIQEGSETQLGSMLCEGPPREAQVTLPAVEADPELDGPLLYLLDCPIKLLHSYSLKSKMPDSEKPRPEESLEPDKLNETRQEPLPSEDTEAETKEVVTKITWKDRVLRTQKYSHLMHHCKICDKDYKGLNVMRHALSHLKRRRLRCILCGKCFKQFLFAKKHILEHIDEMCKQEPPVKEPCTGKKEPCTGKTLAANGIVEHGENQSQPKDGSQTSISNEVTPEKKPVIKFKVSSLSREVRIIRNLRTLVKKTSVLHKKCKNPDANIFKAVDFKDEQVVITDGLVIVKDPTVVKGDGVEGQEADGKEKPSGENGLGHGLDLTYHLCPSETCDRVFLRVSTTLTRHAIKCHIKEEKVLEKTFVWAKNKCTLCLRQLQFIQHYKDHMKLHDTEELQHFCYHLDCSQRFFNQQELKDHIKIHQPFRPQCTFTDCDKLFSSYQALFEHEWRHYIPAPQRDELESGAGRHNNQNAEAPWKQRVKVEEIWLQSKKGQKEGPGHDHVEATNVEDFKEDRSNEMHGPDGGEDLSKSDHCSEIEPTGDRKAAINGTMLPQVKIGASTATTPPKRCQKKAPVELDPLNVKDLEESSTLAEGVQQKLGEPHITEHKSFKPEDPVYATFVKAPFIRPPPSTYMDESLLSMRKRRHRTEEPAAPKKTQYWSKKKKKEPAPEQQQPVKEVAPEQKARHRCDKCLSSFTSYEEFQKHQALNTCSALFGFDSDDES